MCEGTWATETVFDIFQLVGRGCWRLGSLVVCRIHVPVDKMSMCSRHDGCLKRHIRYTFRSLMLMGKSVSGFPARASRAICYPGVPTSRNKTAKMT